VTITEQVQNATCSPDGTWVLYGADSGRKLARLPIEGGTPKVLVTAPLGISGAISRDGKWVLGESQEIGPDSNPVKRISVIPADGGDAVHVFPEPPGVVKAEWSPDGKAIQFVLTKKGASNIWEQPLAGGELRQVTNFTSGQIFEFNWTDDGKDLLVARGEIRSDVVLISDFR
jgi:Tol biopolymer transport system component